MSAIDRLVDHCFATLGGSTRPILGFELLAPVHRVAATLYMHGPAISIGHLNLGFWQGRELADICSQLTGVRSELWRANPDACAGVLAERFFGVYYAVYVALAVWTAWSVVRACVPAALRAAWGAVAGRAVPGKKGD